MRWVEMALVALAVDLVLIAAGLVVVRRAMRQALGPMLQMTGSRAARAPLAPREDRVAAP